MRNVLPRFVMLLAMLQTLAGCDSLVTKPSLYSTVTAQVTRRDSSPVPGSQLVLYTGARQMAYAVTDATGRFVFKDVPYGVYGVRAVPPYGYVQPESVVGGPDSGYRDQIELTGGQTVGVHFTFVKVGLGTITARVLNESGAPLANVPLLLYTTAGVLQRVITNAAGSYTFSSLPTGDYGVTAMRADEYRDSTETAFPARDGFLVEENSFDSATFVFKKCSGSVNAQVRDSSGSAVSGAVVTLYNASGALQTATLDATGARLFSALPCGVYGVRATVPSEYVAAEGFGTSFRDQLVLHRDQNLPAVLIVARSGVASIRVKVVDDAGLQLQNIRVVAYTGAGIVGDIATDAGGFSTFNFLPVSVQYGVRVVPRAGYTVREAPGSSFLDGIMLTTGLVRDIVFVLKRD